MDTSAPTGSMLFTILAALAQMEHDIKSERITGSISKKRAAGKDLGGRHRRTTESRICSALHLIQNGETTAQVIRDLGISRSAFYRRAAEITP